MTPGPIERYGLYGEPVGAPEPRFLHVEPIRLRSGHFSWRIDPHRHDDLHQILLITQGGGTMEAEGTSREIVVPALLVVPAGAVHAFAFLDGTDGWVVSIAQAALAPDVRSDGAVIALLEQASCTSAVAPAPAEAMAASYRTLSEELAWSAPGRRVAIEGEVLRLLAAAARLVGGARRSSLADPDAVLAERFRSLVEQKVGSAIAVSDCARDLGVSRDRLLRACRERFGRPPTAILHRRILVEAQRWLIYTARPIAEIGRALGFEDPAYFSRFFKKHAGIGPRAYRQSARETRAR